MHIVRLRFPVDDIVARVSQIMTLLPGDVIEGIGSLKNTVVKL